LLNGCNGLNGRTGAAAVHAEHSSGSSRSPHKQRSTPHSSPLKQQQYQHHHQQQLRSPQRQPFSEHESVTELSASEAAVVSDAPVVNDAPPMVTAVVTLQSAVAAAVGDVSSAAGQLAAVGKQFDMQVKRLQVTLFDFFHYKSTLCCCYCMLQLYMGSAFRCVTSAYLCVTCVIP
jgi:hypothetical protein